ncbi:MAG: hypothetical protein IE909_16155 [Campylobacterales bacterium]|nr:hypothetical protein [Campylobacterales bacterium]
MENNELVIDLSQNVKSAVVSKRFSLSQESYKKLKIIAIENDLDNDGKIGQESLNSVLDHIISAYQAQQLRLKALS